MYSVGAFARPYYYYGIRLLLLLITMRTKDNETHTMLTEFMDHFYEKVCKDKDDSGSYIIIKLLY